MKLFNELEKFRQVTGARGISKKYFVKIEDEVFGPISDSELLTWKNQKRIQLDSFVYCHERKEWKTLGAWEEFSFVLPELPQDIPQVEMAYYTQNNRILGPATPSEVFRLVDKKEISIFEFIYFVEEKKWFRICEHPLAIPFMPEPPQEKPELKERVDFDKTLKDFNPQLLDFLRTESAELTAHENPPKDKGYVRIYERASYSGQASIIKGDMIFNGSCTVIGQGGCYVECNPKDLVKGEEVLIKISPGLVPIKIETKAQIAHVNPTRPRMGIGVQFLELEQRTAREIQFFVDKFLSLERRKP